MTDYALILLSGPTIQGTPGGSAGAVRRVGAVEFERSFVHGHRPGRRLCWQGVLAGGRRKAPSFDRPAVRDAALQNMQLTLKRLRLWALAVNDGGDGSGLEGPDFDAKAGSGGAFRDTLAQIAARYDDFMDTSREVGGDGGGTTAERIARLARGE